RSHTYAGNILHAQLKNDESVHQAKNKLNGSFYSVKPIGTQKGGLNPMVAVKILMSVILPTAMFGCELWNNLSCENIYSLDVAYRQIAKIIQGYEHNVSSDVVLYTLGLLPISCYINNAKLLFFDRLCRTFHVMTRRVFLFRLSSFLLKGVSSQSGFIHEIMMLNLISDYVDSFVKTGKTIHKVLFKKMVKYQVHSQEEQMWLARINANSNLVMFSNIQIQIEPSFAWIIGKRNPTHLWQLANLVYLSTIPNYKSFQCKKCNILCKDIVAHFLRCSYMLNERNDFLEHLVDILPVNDSVKLLSASEDIFEQTILGSRVDIFINDDIYDQFIIECATSLYHLDSYFKVIKS
ncbi:unnamed protein product, partial [Owenia fusiformis]